MQNVFAVLLDWRVLLISVVLLFTFPLVFFLSSLDKRPVKIKRIKLKSKKNAAASSQRSDETLNEQDREHGLAE
ncbi:MAG TPA: hypothetical protein ENN69_01985 [Spirochaetia bacterium]|nr:hypothetical protein [Spirochaetia bacterium]